jgi:hypothetical protein
MPTHSIKRRCESRHVEVGDDDDPTRRPVRAAQVVERLRPVSGGIDPDFESALATASLEQDDIRLVVFDEQDTRLDCHMSDHSLDR